jgi:hypothetical protein
VTARLRDWRITVGELRVGRPQRCTFEIERTLRRRIQRATVKLYNLTRDHQAQIQSARAAQVIVEAGYIEDRGLEMLFSGELRRARGMHVPPSIFTTTAGRVDAITQVTARDGDRAYREARIAQSFERGVSITTVARACVSAMELGSGNLDEALAGVQAETGGSTYPEGTVLTGSAAHELTRVLEGLGLTWSVQHGSVQVLGRGEALDAPAVRLTPDTGLVGSPQLGTRGRCTATALLTPDLSPGRIVLLESARIRGRFVCRSVTYRGDSHGQDWYAELALRPEAA